MLVGQNDTMALKAESMSSDEKAYYKEVEYLLMQISEDLQRPVRIELMNMIRYCHPDAAARNDLEGTVKRAIEKRRQLEARIANIGTYVKEAETVTNQIGLLPDSQIKKE